MAKPDDDGVWRCVSHGKSPEARATRRSNAKIGQVKGGRKSRARVEAERLEKETGVRPPTVIVVPRMTDVLTDDGWSDAINEAYAAVRDRVRQGDASAIASAVQLLRAAQSEMQRRSEAKGEDARLAKALEIMGGM